VLVILITKQRTLHLMNFIYSETTARSLHFLHQLLKTNSHLTSFSHLDFLDFVILLGLHTLLETQSYSHNWYFDAVGKSAYKAVTTRALVNIL
jgi:hypothetical protein